MSFDGNTDEELRDIISINQQAMAVLKWHANNSPGSMQANRYIELLHEITRVKEVLCKRGYNVWIISWLALNKHENWIKKKQAD